MGYLNYINSVIVFVVILPLFYSINGRTQQCPYIFNEPIFLPVPGSENVPINAKIRLELPEGMVLSQPPEVSMVEVATSRGVEGIVAQDGEYIFEYTPMRPLSPQTEYTVTFRTDFGNYTTTFKTGNILDETPPSFIENPKVESWDYYPAEHFYRHCPQITDVFEREIEWDDGFIVNLLIPELNDDATQYENIMFILYLTSSPGISSGYQEIAKFIPSQLDPEEKRLTIYLSETLGNGRVCFFITALDLMERVSVNNTRFCVEMEKKDIFASLCNVVSSSSKNEEFIFLLDFILILVALSIIVIRRKRRGDTNVSFN